MKAPSLAKLSDHIRQTYAAEQLVELADNELLARFIGTRDAAAFEALVRRHGPSVLGAARRVLRDSPEIDDVFQAAFLTLLRRGASIRSRGSVRAWLCGVAHRLAVRAGRAAARRQFVEQRSRRLESRADDLTWVEANAVLHEELDQLPDRFRLPLLLCYLEGLSREEAAERLGWKPGSIKAGLERGRKALRERLARRGVTLSAGLLTATVCEDVVAAPAELIRATISAATGRVPRTVADLLNAGTTPMIARLKIAFAAVATVALLAGLSGTARTKGEPPPPTAKVPSPQAFSGRVVDGEGKAVLDAEIVAGDGRSLAKTGSDGRFEFESPRKLDLIVARKKGFGPDWAVPSADMTLRLPKDDVVVRGHLLDLEGRPVAHATIRVARIEADPKDDMKAIVESLKSEPSQAILRLTKKLADPALAGLPATIATDETGTFELRGVGRDRVVVLVPEANGLDCSLIRVIADPGFNAEMLSSKAHPQRSTAQRGRNFNVVGPNFHMSLRPSQAVTGIVRDARSKKPVAGVVVSHWYAGTFPPEEVTTVTDGDGRFRLDGAPKGRPGWAGFQPTVDSPHFHQMLMLEPVEGLAPIPVDVELIRGVAVKGRITDAATGRPLPAVLQYYPLRHNPTAIKLAHAQFVLPDREYTADADGRYIFVVPPGPGVIFAQVDAKRLAVHDYPDGRVRDADREWAFSGTELSFDAIAVHSRNPNRYQPMIHRQDYRIVETTNEPLTIDFRLHAAPRARINLEDAEGKPVTGVTVVGLNSEWDQPTIANRSDLTVRAIAPDRTRVMAFALAEKGLAAAVTVKGGGGEQVIRLTSAASVVGRALDRDGQPLANVRVGIKYETTAAERIGGRHWSSNAAVRSGSDGKFRLDGVFPGQRFAIFFIMDSKSLDGATREKLIVNSGETLDFGDLKAAPLGP